MKWGSVIGTGEERMVDRGDKRISQGPVHPEAPERGLCVGKEG